MHWTPSCFIWFVRFNYVIEKKKKSSYPKPLCYAHNSFVSESNESVLLLVCSVFENNKSVLLLICFVFKNNESALLLMCFVFEYNESVFLLMCFVIENKESV